MIFGFMHSDPNPIDVAGPVDTAMPNIGCRNHVAIDGK